jgi:cell division septation protein DedD
VIRIAFIGMLMLALAVTGCSKKKEEAKALQQEAAQDEAASAMDSLTQKPPMEDTVTEVTPKPAAQQEPAETKPAEPEYPQEAGFVVQVGSYLNHDLATSMVEKYKNRGYDAFLVPAEVNGQEFYRLRIGVFDTYAEAKQVGEQLADRYSAVFWLDNNR